MTGTSLAHVATEATQLRDAEHETATAAVASQAKAAVEARYMVALHRPRNMDAVRVKILETCKRPGFAATARYSKPIGKTKVVGPTVRFAEEAARALGNLLIDAVVLFDSEDKRVVGVTVTDLEANLSYTGNVSLEKTVERSVLKEGQAALGQRINSKGELTYLVAATEDDLLNKQNAAISKLMRNGVLRVLPSDILEEAMAQVITTQRDRDAKDPAGARKDVVDAFFALGVSPVQLVEYLGHPLEQITPVELVELRTVYSALKEGEASWVEAMEAKHGDKKTTGAGSASLLHRVKKVSPDPVPAAATSDAPAAGARTDEDVELDRMLDEQDRAGGAE